MRSLVLACVLVASTRADADPARAWAAAQANLPASTQLVLGANVDAVNGSSSLNAFGGAMTATLGVNKVLESIKTTCKIDPTKAIDGLVMVEGATSDVGAFYLSLDGVDQAALMSCMTRLELDAKVSIAWVAPDVIAIATKPADKAMLQTFTSGKGALAKSPLGKLVAKTNTASTIWVASTKSRAVQGRKMKHGRGGLELAKNTLTLTMAMTFSSAKEAKNVAKLANDQIVSLLASGQLDAIVMEMLNKVSITTNASEVVIVGSVPEKELMPLIQAMAAPQ